MKNLSNAEIYVDTRFSIESGGGDGNWFRLADYSSLSEFFVDCTSWFDGEDDPEYVYTAWTDIPAYLINENWLCPNIFEIRDAMQTIDEGLLDTFLSWCKTYGWDITTEDPYRIVTEFQYSVRQLPTSESEAPEQEDYDTDGSSDERYIHAMAIRDYSTDIFDDNYN